MQLMAEQPVRRFICQKRQLTGQNLHNKHAKCDMRGYTNYEDSGGPTVYFIFLILGLSLHILNKNANLHRQISTSDKK